MEVHILYRFPVTARQRELPCVWLLQEKTDGILAVVYASGKVPTSPSSCSLSLHLLNVKTRSLVKEVIVSSPTPDIEELHLAYDVALATWVLGSLEFHTDTSSYHALVRTVREDEYGRGVLADPLFDDQANDMASIGPFFTLTAHNHRCIFLYRKPAQDAVATPEICLERIELITGQVKHAIVDYAESALVCQREHASLLLALVPQRSILAKDKNGALKEVMHYWSFALTGYGEGFDTVHWKLDLGRSLPGRRAVLGRGNDFEWLGINAAAIPGPLVPQTGKQTFVVGMAMMDIFDRKGYGHTSEEASRIMNKVETLFCIDISGEVVQTCTDTIGLRLHLCQIDGLIVGVDLLEGRWRLWNWNLLNEPRLKMLVELHQHVIRAHVVSEMEWEEKQERHFWLIEEYSEQVKVAKRDAVTLLEVTPAVSLDRVHLLAPQNGSGSLDWHTALEAMVYEDTLLLLAVDENERLVLYQVK